MDKVYTLELLENMKRNTKHISEVLPKDHPKYSELTDLVNHLDSLIHEIQYQVNRKH